MLSKTLAIVAIAAGTVAAQRPNGTSICDYYTTALLKDNTAANQYTLLTLIVNTAVIGNYTTPNVGLTVPGILAANASFNGVAVNLLPYFNGELLSTNNGGSSGVSMNFLDGGGAAPLKENKPANDTTSNQYLLLTHLYEYFGVLLGCSMTNNTDFPAYSGDDSMYETHKFMDLSYPEFQYFVSQVAASAQSFGVANSDLTMVGAALGSLFGFKCLPAATVIPSQGPQLQSICTGDNCPLAADAACDGQADVAKPSPLSSSLSSSTAASGTATGTTANGPKATTSASATASGTQTSTSNTPAAATTNAASREHGGLVAVVGGLLAMLL